MKVDMKRKGWLKKCCRNLVGRVGRVLKWVRLGADDKREMAMDPA